MLVLIKGLFTAVGVLMTLGFFIAGLKTKNKTYYKQAVICLFLTAVFMLVLTLLDFGLAK